MTEAKPQIPGWGAFLKEIARVGTSGDLASLQAPAFILSDFSIIEFTSYWGEPTELFLAIKQGKTEEDRHLRVLKWYLASFVNQFTARETKFGNEKKPFNPFLGEQFNGEWIHNGITVTSIAEQVSHHPPISAYTISAPGIKLQGNNAQRTSFSSGTIVVKQTGHSILTIDLPSNQSEQYLITYPKLQILGLLFGSPYVELCEKSFIQSSHGLLSTMEFKGKGYFSGKPHTVIANITKSKSPIYTIEGSWSKISTFTSVSSSSSEGNIKVGDVFCDFEKVIRKEITIKEFKDQNEFESRNAWKDVAEGIRLGQYEKAQIAKVKIESEQREKRKLEIASGLPFELRLFTRIESDPVYKKLAGMCNLKPENEDSFHLKA